jgi:dienelactone hydrolase
MHRARRKLLLLALLLALPAGRHACAQEDPARYPLINNQGRTAVIAGDRANPVGLVVTLFAPAGRPPFPVAIVLHDATGSPQSMQRLGAMYLTAYFLSRGYAVAQPMMRGFAGSGGAAFIQGCDLAASAIANARDIAAVLDDLRASPGLDLSRVAVAGMGFGGWNALALTHQPPPGVRAVVSFFPAMADTVCPPVQAQPALLAGARAFGAGASVPLLWVYGAQTDATASPQPAMVAAYRAAGGQAQALDIGNFMNQPPSLMRYPEGLALWVPPLDRLLAGAGLPATEQTFGYLPVVPPATSFASINDASAIPWIADSGRQVYANFHKVPAPKAFVISADGTADVSYGGYDPLRGALAACQNQGRFCIPYAYDDSVVWPITPPAKPSGYAAIGDVARIPYVSDHGRADYRSFLTWPLPRAFAVAPIGWTSAQGPQAAVSALAQCRARFHDCALYAIDNAVVWQPQE